MDFQSEKVLESWDWELSNHMYVEACRRCRRWKKNIQTHFYHTFLNMVSFECNPMYVEDVKDRSNTPKAVMLYTSKMSKMSKIDQIHLRAVMLCMSKMSKMGKEHTHTFWLITSLIHNGFSIRKKFWNIKSYVCWSMSKMSKMDQIHLRAVMLCMSKMSKMGKEHTHTSSTSLTCFDIHRIWWYGWKALSLSFHIPCALFELRCRL